MKYQLEIGASFDLVSHTANNMDLDGIRTQLAHSIRAALYARFLLVGMRITDERIRVAISPDTLERR